MTWSEQQAIESHAPVYLRNVIRILTETGLSIYKELAPLRKEHPELLNKLVFIADSKIPSGVAEVPLTDIAAGAFQSQMEVAGPGPWLFPSSKRPIGYQTNFMKTWERTLRNAGIPYFRLYDLRSTHATRLSAGGVADEWVTHVSRATLYRALAAK
jgi:integrase